MNSLFGENPMTKRQKMFHEIGMAFGRIPEERTKRQRAFTFNGLCTATEYYGFAFLEKRFRVGRYWLKSWDGSGWWCPSEGQRGHSCVHDLWRSDFAFLLSYMSDEDYNLIVRE